MSKASNNPNPVLFDIIYLREGKTLDEAIEYFEKVADIAHQHGLVMENVYAVQKTMRGNIPQPALINIWRLESSDAMQKMGADPQYQEMVPTRDALFAMDQLSLFMAEGV